MKALIIGAGPGGLSAGLALAQKGISVDLVEIKPNGGALGSELFLSSANLRALDILGVADRCVELGSPISTSSKFRTQDGTLMAEVMLPLVAREGLPQGVGIQREKLHQALHEACAAHGVNVQFGTSFTDIKETANGAQVSLSNGTVETYDLVIGADGVNSKVRQTVFPDAAQPEYVGQYVWRAKVNYDGPSALELFAGAHCGAGFVTTSPDTAYMFCLTKENEGRRLEGQALMDAARDQFGKFGSTIGDYAKTISSPEDCSFLPLRPVLVEPSWHKGHVLLIGDAAHAVTPHLAHGAGLAVEDGVVIAEELHRTGNVQAAFAAFMTRRFDRCRATVDTCIKLSKLQQDAPGPTPEQAQLTQQGLGLLAQPI